MEYSSLAKSLDLSSTEYAEYAYKLGKTVREVGKTHKQAAPDGR